MYLQFFIIPCCFIINLGCFIIILYHFLVLTYWHSAKCHLLFSTCFLHRRKSISDRVQMPCQFTMIFYGPEGRQWALVAPGGAPRGAQPARARLGGLCPPRVPPGPPLCSINTQIFQKPKGMHLNIHPTAAESRTTRSDLDTITEGFTTSVGASLMMRE